MNAIAAPGVVDVSEPEPEDVPDDGGMGDMMALLLLLPLVFVRVMGL